MNGSEGEPELKLLASYAGRDGQELKTRSARREYGWAGGAGETTYFS